MGRQNPSTLPSDFFFGAAMSGPQTEGMWQAHGKPEWLRQVATTHVIG